MFLSRKITDFSMIQKIMIEWAQYLSKVCVCVCASIGKEGERAGSRKRERQKEAGSRLQVKHIFAGVCVRAMGRPRARAKIQSKSNKQLDAANLPICGISDWPWLDAIHWPSLQSTQSRVITFFY